MCGIIGIIGKTSKKEVKTLLKPVKHRGNKQNEMLIFKKGALGVNRLEIVDPENGKQPFSNKNKTIFAIMNGEIFNHNQLRKDLTKRGHRFKTKCDTEIIPVLFEEYGYNFAEHIDSEMYAIIIYNKRKNEWIVARDFLGVKPLYYAEDKEKTYFSSEAKQLTKIKSEINIFPPGSTWVNGIFMKQRSLNKTPSLKSDKSSIDKIRTYLNEAIKKRIPENLKLGILFSGGIDSSAILVTALKYSKDIIAFIVGTKESKDRKPAEELCRKLNVKYEVIDPPKIREKDFRRLIEILETDEENTIKHSWTAYLACKRASKKGLKVLLCGEGADELFGGYNVFKKIKDNSNHEARLILTKNLYLSQLPRVDRTSMAFTIEVRCPFLDKKLLDLALNLKTTNLEGKDTKEVFRKAMEDRLPNWITKREKVPIGDGSGVKIGGKDDFAKAIKIGEKEFIQKTFNQFGYNKIIKPRAINKDNLLKKIKPFYPAPNMGFY